MSPLRYLNFANASNEELALLAEACEAATFGRNHEDVLDETYRKAGKLDAEDFATSFEVQSSNLVSILRDKLLIADSEANIRAERYKINVYGKRLPCIPNRTLV